MSAKTAEELYDLLSSEFAWRRKELTYIRSLIESGRVSADAQNVLLRAGVTLLYAHWEGFVRAASRAYLEFIAVRRLKNKELALNFLALSGRKLLRDAQATDRVAPHLAVATFFLHESDARSYIPFNDGIDTESNLSSKVLKDIVGTLGLQYSDYVTKEKLLDEKLLRSRNSIAHGEYVLLGARDYKELQFEVLQMMETFRTQIDNAASQGVYRAARTDAL